MTNEQFTELLERLRPVDEGIHSVKINEEDIAGLTREQAEQVVALYGASALMTLPKKEQEFFAWLRANDEPVWNDLWGGDEVPYQVSLGYLPDLLPNRRGFLICDLVDSPNYFFNVDSITQEDGVPFLDAAMEIIKNDGKLSLDQAFVVEVWRAPIDQWRFAYMYRQPLGAVKEMVQWLIDEEILSQPQPEPSDEQWDQQES